MIIKTIRHPQFKILLFLAWWSTCNVLLAQDWQSEYYRDHNLVGKIWDTENKLWLTGQQLQLQLRQYDYILLGEVHENADHHILQARLLESLSESNSKPAVVMEMLEKESWANQPITWSDYVEAINQAKLLNEGWSWDLYAPIFQVIAKHKLELFAGNISSEALHAKIKKSGNIESKKVINKYSVTQNALENLKHDIVESHCGYADPEFVNFMVQAQLQRDYVLTTSLINIQAPVVLIAGAGHVRNNYAVPMQLMNKFTRISYISISFIQVNPSSYKPEEYVDSISPDFDILYFTPSYTDQDPCVKYSKQLQRMQDSQSP